MVFGIVLFNRSIILSKTNVRIHQRMSTIKGLPQNFGNTLMIIPRENCFC